MPERCPTCNGSGDIDVDPVGDATSAWSPCPQCRPWWGRVGAASCWPRRSVGSLAWRTNIVSSRWCISIFLACLAVACLWTLNAVAAPAARPPVAARYSLLLELELLQDGSSRVVNSQVLSTSAQMVEAAKRMLASEAGAAAPLSSPQAAGSDRPAFAGQCEAEAVSSGKRCRKKAVAGSRFCELHQGRGQ